MRGLALCVFCLLGGGLLSAASFNYTEARKHEIKPHRYTIPLEGEGHGFHQLRLTLTVSPAGLVTDARAAGDSADLKFWPQLEPEVRAWKYTPFEENGKAVTADVEEYLELVPPEQLPMTHVTPPVVKANSNVKITLSRGQCYGRCPAYSVSVSTRGIVFDGYMYVAAKGKFTDTVDPEAVRKLAKKFVAADFYSMEPLYHASVTDNPTYQLAIEIDGVKKEVTDYVGQWVGMPAVIVDLEQEVDALARTQRWIKGEGER